MKISSENKKTVLLVIFTLVWLAIGTAILLKGWSTTWTALHIPVLSPPLPFEDMRTVKGSLHSFEMGLNPQVKNPGDPWYRAMNYPIIWLWIAKLLQFDHEINFIIFVCVYILAYLVCCFLLLRNAPSFYVFLMAFSWSSLLAVERGNNDLLAFVLLFTAITLSQKYFQALLILFATLLKVYPALLVVSFIKKPKILIVLILIIASYFIFRFSELKIIQTGNTALSDPSAMFASYGFDTSIRNILLLIPGHSPAAYAFIKYLFIFVSLLLIVILSRMRYYDLSGNSVYKTDLFISGGVIFSGTYLLTSNWDYRLIFLIFCIPYILSIQNQFVKHSTLAGILLSSNFGFLWANPSLSGSLLCAMIKYYVFLSVSVCLFKEITNTLPVAIRDRLKQVNIPIISSNRLTTFIIITLERAVGEVKSFFLKPSSWLRVIVLLVVLVYFGHTAQEYFIPRLLPHYGTLNLHITGLRPPGHIIIHLKTDYSQNFSRSVSMAFSGKEMTYAVEGLYFGDYFIQVIHDENNNQTADQDSETALFSEGFGMANLDKLSRLYAEAVKEGGTPDSLKYTFKKNGETVEIKMYYPPFPWQKK